MDDAIFFVGCSIGGFLLGLSVSMGATDGQHDKRAAICLAQTHTNELGSKASLEFKERYDRCMDMWERK